MARQLSIHHDVDRDEVVINGVRYHASVFEWLANPSPGVAYTFERRDEVVTVKRVEPSGWSDAPRLPDDAIYSFVPNVPPRFDGESHGVVAFDVASRGSDRVIVSHLPPLTTEWQGDAPWFEEELNMVQLDATPVDGDAPIDDASERTIRSGYTRVVFAKNGLHTHRDGTYIGPEHCAQCAARWPASDVDNFGDIDVPAAQERDMSREAVHKRHAASIYWPSSWIPRFWRGRRA